MGGEVRQVVSPPFSFPFSSPPLSIPPKFSDKPVGGKVRSSEGEVPRLPPYKYHPAVAVVVVIGADRILMLGAQFFLACPQVCVVPPISGAQWGIPQWKTDIVKITQVKKQGTVDLVTMFRRIHHKKFKAKILYTMTHKNTPKSFFEIGVSRSLQNVFTCAKIWHLLS